MKPRRHATYPQCKQIEAKLLQVLKPHPKGGYVYDAGWDDGRVSKTVAEYLSADSTKNVRLSLDPPMELRRIKIKTTGSIEERLSRLEQIINKLAADLGAETEQISFTVPPRNGNGVGRSLDVKLDELLS